MNTGPMSTCHSLILGFFLIFLPHSALASKVVVYTSVDDIFARPIAQKFEREAGIQVLLVTDTEETKSTGLLHRLIAEKKRPRADVFWSGDPVRTAILQSKFISDVYISPNAKSLPKFFSDPSGHWTGFSARARVILYNKKHFPNGEYPSSIFDLINPKYKGKTCIANPLFGTASMHAAALFEVLGEQKAKRFFNDMIRNKVRMVSSNGEVKRLVSSGDLAFGVTDTDDANEAIKEGKPVGVVFPDEQGIGTLIIPNTVMLVKNSLHPKEAKKFIDFLLTADTERALAKSAAQMPVRPGLKTKYVLRSVDKISHMKINYSNLATRLETLTRGFLKKWVALNK